MGTWRDPRRAIRLEPVCWIVASSCANVSTPEMPTDWVKDASLGWTTSIFYQKPLLLRLPYRCFGYLSPSNISQCLHLPLSLNPCYDYLLFGRIAQLVRAPRWHRGGHWFESSCVHFYRVINPVTNCDLKFVFAAAARLCLKKAPAKSWFKSYRWNLTAFQPNRVGIPRL